MSRCAPNQATRAAAGARLWAALLAPLPDPDTTNRRAHGATQPARRSPDAVDDAETPLTSPVYMAVRQ